MTARASISLLHGAFLDVTLSCPAAWSAMRDPGLAVLEPVRGRALIDTGAAVTCVRRSDAERLALPRVGGMRISGVQVRGRSEQGTELRVVTVTIAGLGAYEVHAALLDDAGSGSVILGRDLLCQVEMSWSGREKLAEVRRS